MSITTLRASAIMVAAVTAVAALPTALWSQTLELRFEPPEMEVAPICVARSSDTDLIAAWGEWDGKALPDRDTGLINRDMRRLAEIDPVAWDATIQAVITLLPQVSPSFTQDHVTLARIEQMIATGDLQALNSAGLVQKLLDRGEENSPRMLNALAGYLTEGVGIERDAARGAEMLMAAGYGGNADALLKLSHQSVAGTAPEGWDINPQLAVTMAFGALVGQMDPLICDRIARIAREYSSGEVVQLDHDLALRWYRFAADLGDPLAAWRVAEYELQSELVTKDNAVLLTYLQLAAAGGLPYAQVTLGRAYETGALVPADLERAQQLYEAAARNNDRAALIRLSGFLESQLAARPELGPEFVETLVRLGDLPAPPPWVFGKHAALIQADKGRWDGSDEAYALLQRGAALDDSAAIQMLAQMDLGTATTDAAFYAVVDRLIHAVTNLGEAGPTADLQAAFLCKAPGAPLLDQAAYWAKTEDTVGSSSTPFNPDDLTALADNPEPLTMAALQTQALYGRATPLANFLAVLEQRAAPASEQAFWVDYAARYPNVGTARAALALSQATTPVAHAAALDMFRAAHAAGEEGAALKLGDTLLTDATPEARAEALVLLTGLAQTGNGAAMLLLPRADPGAFPDLGAVYSAYAPAIAARGDFEATLLAMPFLPDEAGRETYRQRAMTAMQCSFPEAIAMAQVEDQLDNPDEARRWLSIATHLAGDDGWKIVELADSSRALLDDEAEPTALALYERAHDLGNRTAVQRLLRLKGNPKRPGYDPEDVVTLYVELVTLSTPDQIPQVLTDLARKETSLRQAVEARLDLDTLYRRSAEAGNPAAMREHATRLQAAATTGADIEASTKWLIRASEAGDVQAMVTLAQAYSMGVGVAPSLTSARGWLEKAALAGDPTAISMVKLFTVNAETN
ncbi:hypothetical protein [Frigidibacter sp.]|uniref:hypothetical protein n=1 Tax=Frigidibacter sp. TaxID=2586418 RepID=UPI0027346AF1|nr:hypothetical protein [Frigidibacter sp.]MDP3342284.1 hypothetical protein [Frigidibacter sp.]